MADYQIPRMTPAELIEDLRDEAQEIGLELQDIPVEETVAGQAAQLIEEMGEALTRFAAGEPDPQAIAQAALDAQAPLKPIDGPMDSLKRLLKLRSM